MKRYSYSEIASDHALWEEYFDPNQEMSEESFNNLDTDEKIQMMIDADGKEQECGECDYRDSSEAYMEDHINEHKYDRMMSQLI